MHIEPGIVTGAKFALSYATAAGAATYSLKLAVDTLRLSAVPMMALRSVIATALVFNFFQVLPHFSVGISEVHFILGSTLFLTLGALPAATGLALGLLAQGLFFAPTDLPQYAMNVTTLLVPLFAMAALAKRIIAPDTAYSDLKYGQAFALSTAYQGGVVAWVAFWAFYGQGFGAANVASVLTSGGAYMMAVLLEPLADLAVLGMAKSLRGVTGSGIFASRVYKA